MSGSSYYSQSDFRLHFGLGARRAKRTRSRSRGRPVSRRPFGTCPPIISIVIQETKGIVSRQPVRVDGRAWRSWPRALGHGRVAVLARHRRWHPPRGRAVHRRRRRPPASTSSTRTPPRRTSTCSRPWAAAWPCSTTTTTAGSTCSSPTARGSTIRMPAGKRPDKSDRRFWNRLYQQRPTARFTDVTEKAGLSGDAAEPLRHGRRRRRLRQRRLRRPLRHRLWRQHALSQQGRRHLRRRDRAGRRRAPAGGARAPASSTTTTTAASICSSRATWSGRFQNNRHCGEKKPGYRAYCHPDNFEASTNILYRNNGDGTFTDVSVEGRHRRAPAARASASRSPTTTATASSTSTSPTTPCSRSSTATRATARSTEVGLLAGVGFNEDGKTFAGMGVDFADYDNDGRPDVIVTDLSNERYRALPPERRRQLPRRRPTPSGVGARHAAVLGLEHALLRLRQRRLEGPVRRPGARDGHHREDLAEPAYLQPPLLLRNETGRFVQGRCRATSFSRSGPAAAPPSATWTTTATSTSWSATSDSRPRAAQRRRQSRQLAGAYGRSGTTIEPRRHRLPGESRVRLRLTQHFTINTAVGYLSASDKRLLVGLGADASAKLVEIRWPSGAVQRFDNVKSGQTLVGDRAGRTDHGAQQSPRCSPVA